MYINSKEIWKDIDNYEGLYQVSTYGRIRSLARNTNNPVKPHQDGIIRKQYIARGYNEICLHKDGIRKTYLVHRLVAKAFIPNPDNLPEVNHKDGNKLNNHVSNLEWVTKSQNVKHAIALGLIDKNSLEVRSTKGTIKRSIRMICLDSGEVFASKHQANHRLKITCVDEGTTHKGQGFTFKIISESKYQQLKEDQLPIDEYDKIYKDIKDKISGQGVAAKVICLEQKRIYESFSEAARANNMSIGTVQHAVKENRSCKGLTFKIID